MPACNWRVAFNRQAMNSGRPEAGDPSPASIHAPGDDRGTQGNGIHAIREVGDRGLLISLGTAGQVQQLRIWVLGQPRSRRLVEVIPGARTLFLTGPREVLAWFARSAWTAHLPEPDPAQSRRIVVPVRYDGPDLAAVAERTGMTQAQLIAEHSDAEYRVDFFGFAPGQAFFSGVPDSLNIPRRASPRVRVPSGSLAIANEFTVIYPGDSPGGWNLIGTRAGPPLWDSSASPPNRVEVGDTVVFQVCR